VCARRKEAAGTPGLAGMPSEELIADRSLTEAIPALMADTLLAAGDAALPHQGTAVVLQGLHTDQSHIRTAAPSHLSGGTGTVWHTFLGATGHLVPIFQAS